MSAVLSQNLSVSDTCEGDATVFTYTGSTTNIDTIFFVFTVPPVLPSDVDTLVAPFSSPTTVTHTYLTTGAQTAGVITVDNSNTTVVNLPLNFTILGSPVWNYQDTSIACADTFTLDATQPGNATYNWTGFPGGSNASSVQILPSYFVGYPPSNPNPTCGRLVVNCSITNDCGTETYTVVIFRNDPSLIPNNITICPGDVLSLSVDFCAPVENRMEYTWSDGTTNSSIPVSTAGLYYVTVTDDSCYYTIDSTQIIVAQPFTFNFGPDTVLCAGDSIVLDAGIDDPNAQFSWTFPTGVTNPGNDSLCVATLPGTYQVFILDGADCFQVDDDIVIDEPQVLAPDLGPDTILCAGDTLFLDPGIPPANGNFGYVYTWQDGSASTNFAVTAGGTYRVTISDPCSEYIDSVFVDQPPAISVDLGVDQILCEDDSILLDPTVPPGVTYDYLWNDGSSANTLWVYTDGEYWVQIQGDCDLGRDTVQIDPYVEAPFFLNTPPASICDGLTDTLFASYPGALSYEWPDFSTDSTFIVSTSGDYWAIAYHECGSTSSDTVTYVFENCACNIFIPNAFSPNLQGPGQNEHFRVSLTSDCYISKYQIAIYDRWGKEVFYSEDINQPWDGTFDGMDCDQGVYMYRIYYELPNFTRVDIRTATGYLYLLK